MLAAVSPAANTLNGQGWKQLVVLDPYRRIGRPDVSG